MEQNEAAPPSTATKAVKPRQIRADGWTIPRQRQFLKLLAQTGSVSDAAQAVQMTTASAYRLRYDSRAWAFSNAWAAAIEACVGRVRELAFDQAIHGIRKPMIQNGKMVGIQRIHSERMMMFLMRHYDNPKCGGDSALVIAMRSLTISEIRRPKMLASPPNCPIGPMRQMMALPKPPPNRCRAFKTYTNTASGHRNCYATAIQAPEFQQQSRNTCPWPK